MKHSSRPRNTAHLSESVHQQLNMYTLAAGAAGVSLLCLTPPCDAKIVYTPAHVVIGHGGIREFDINFTHHGTNDLAIRTFHNSCTDECLANLYARVPSGKGIAGKAILGLFSCSAWALRRGDRIGPRAQFHAGGFGALMVNVSTLTTRRVQGLWHDVTNRYLGVSFTIRGKTHFGWARLTVHDKGHAITAVLTGYAYETIPSKAIIAGKTKDISIEQQHDPGPGAYLTNPILDTPQLASLGMLAVGARGIPLWRRKDSVLKGD
jgi:hypothetical protein